ncbi:CAP domain-containing protein [Lyngbya confervoides]|uniref:CAP domain-containing protein n=1 Tax=Lyngbya confervoides BDU141951 TaxID=1574623 RepID=A0ABD4T4E5_9CYAN|nr:CAP domain-containing protein [Lyngbya confervoides]MCM1983568.1 CAP domain-containing protein [Lyngbya confervoides BDU141951]
MTRSATVLLLGLGVLGWLQPASAQPWNASPPSVRPLAPGTTPPAARLARAAERVTDLRAIALRLVNRDRQRQGLPSLSENALLNQVAQRHAEDMIQRNYFSHYSPEGQTPTDRVHQAGGRIVVGENILNYRLGTFRPRRADLVPQFQQLFMGSPQHKRIILKSGFESFGYGFAVTPDGSRIVAVQMFGTSP